MKRDEGKSVVTSEEFRRLIRSNPAACGEEKQMWSYETIMLIVISLANSVDKDLEILFGAITKSRNVLDDCN